VGASGVVVSSCLFLFFVRLPLTGHNMRPSTCWPCFGRSCLRAAWQPNCMESCFAAQTALTHRPWALGTEDIANSREGFANVIDTVPTSLSCIGYAKHQRVCGSRVADGVILYCVGLDAILAYAAFSLWARHIPSLLLLWSVTSVRPRVAFACARHPPPLHSLQ